MKALIATACVAVIAVAGYFFLGEYNSYRTRIADEQKIERVRAELFADAKAEPGQIGRVKEYCQTMRDSLEFKDNDTALTNQIVTNCRVLGYL